MKSECIEWLERYMGHPLTPTQRCIVEGIFLHDKFMVVDGMRAGKKEISDALTAYYYRFEVTKEQSPEKARKEQG